MKTYEYKYGGMSAIIWVNGAPRRIEFVKGFGGCGYYCTSDPVEQKAIESRKDYADCFSVSEDPIEESKKQKVKVKE